MHIECFVSEAVDETFLSSGFLVHDNVQWDYAKALKAINGVEKCSRPKTSDAVSVAAVRRVCKMR